MKSLTLILGAILLVAGIAGFLFGGVPYQSQDTILDVGGIEAQVETEKRMDIPPVASAILLVGGVGVLAWGLKKG
ncbi:MAG: hypothetical protein RJQ04_06915 [Longimicrobiales bacterium]